MNSIKIESEKVVEPYLKKKVEAMGGLCLKFTSPSYTGVPDRLVILPINVIFFVETKTTKKGLSPRQRLVKRLLESLGVKVYVADSKIVVDSILNLYK